ncbi:MAG TPA: serine/threonine-protein kinase [Nocardioides sp.]|nr:serine/threonine-protein kinase [Nocardioides sp.]
MNRTDSWHLAQGEALTPELTAMRLLGGGSAYEAYLAFDEVTYGPVVVKVVRPSQTTDDHTLRGLTREVEMLERVNHPVVVRGLRHELDGQRPHVVLEHIEGPRLSSLVRRYGRLQEQQYLPLAIEVAAALHYFRRIGVVHLDVKPSNIIMGSPARLIDLSVARPLVSAEGSRRIGTDHYMSPEQADPDTHGGPGHPSDVWGLGATLFHAVAGYRPFAKGDPDSRVLSEQYPQLVDAPYALPDHVPDAVVDLLQWALARDPSQRPLPAELADALEPVVAALPAPRLSFKVTR